MPAENDKALGSYWNAVVYSGMLDKDEGLEFIRRMAFDPTYGSSVLAALTHHDPDWVVNAIERLVTPELDPKGLRLEIILYNLTGDAERITRVIQTLRGKLPDARLHFVINAPPPSEIL